MNAYNVQSLFIFFAIISLLAGGVASFYFKRLDSSARYWVVGTLITGGTNLSTVFRDDLSLFWTYSFPIALSGAGFLLMGMGIARLYEQGRMWPKCWFLAIATCLFAVLMEWSRIHAGPKVTLVLSGLLFGLTSIASAFPAHVHYTKTGNVFSMHMRWVMLGLGVLHLVRMQGAVTGWGVQTFGQNTWNLGIWSGIFVFGLLRYITYIAMRIQEQNDERVKAATTLARQEEGQRLGLQLARLERQQSLGIMSASFAHELNQPLTNILNYTELLQHQLKNGALQAEAAKPVLALILSNTGRIEHIVQRIRSYIQPAPLKIERVDLRHTIEDVFALVEPEVRRLGISFDKPQLPAEPLWVRGDPVQLSQVLFNVVRNAMESVAKVQPRRIDLDIQQLNQEILIRVNDTGTGLTEIEVQKAGDLFYTTKISGLGMGLSISKTILAQLGGRLSLENTEQGACAQIAFPDAANP